MAKNNFESLSDNKIEFMKMLALDNNLATCMLNNKPDFKNTTITDAQKYGLMYTQIYPFPRTMSFISESNSYITMKFRYKKVQSANVFKTAYVTFYIFCHNEIIPTDYMVLRQDYMLQCVDRLLNECRSDGWLGKMEFESMEDIIFDSEGKYIGVAITYKNSEFQ